MTTKLFDEDSLIAGIVGEYITYTKDDYNIILRLIKRGNWDDSYLDVIPRTHLNEVFSIALDRKNDEAIDALFPYNTYETSIVSYQAYKGHVDDLAKKYGYRSILRAACRYNHLSIVEMYLKNTPTLSIGLEEAAEGGHTDLIDLLGRNGFKDYMNAAIGAIRGGHLSIGMMFYKMVCETKQKSTMDMAMANMLAVSPRHNLSHIFLDMGALPDPEFLFNLVDYDRFDQIETYAKSGVISLDDVIIAIIDNKDAIGGDLDAISRIIEIGCKINRPIDYDNVLDYIETRQIYREDNIDGEKFKTFLKDRYQIEI